MGGIKLSDLEIVVHVKNDPDSELKLIDFDGFMDAIRRNL